MNSVKISVVIPCFNAGGTIRRLLQQLEQQTLPREQYEIVVVDDGSTDDTAAVVGEFSKVLLLSQSKQGPGAARMAGTDKAQADYVLYLDSDLEASPSLLSEHLQFHVGHPQIMAAGGSVEPSKECPLLSWALVDHLCSWFNAHPGIVVKNPEYFPSLNLSINKKVLIDEHHLRWESGLDHTGEDVVFCYAIRQLGFPLGFISQAVVKHEDRATLNDYLRHMYRWGHHAPSVRGKLKGLKYGFLFPKQPFCLVFTIPFIVVGYTLLIWKSWLGRKPLEVSLSLPQIFVGRVAYAWGVLQGTRENAAK